MRNNYPTLEDLKQVYSEEEVTVVEELMVDYTRIHKEKLGGGYVNYS